MAIESGTFYWALCDRCGNQVGGENDDGGYYLSESEAGARGDVEYYDGRIEKDGKFTCVTCIEDEEAANAQ